MDTNWCTICGKQTLDGALYCSEVCLQSDSDSIHHHPSLQNAMAIVPETTTTTHLLQQQQQAPLSSVSTLKPKDNAPTNSNSHHFLHHHLDHDESTDDLALEYEQLKREQELQDEYQREQEEEQRVQELQDELRVGEQSQNLHLQRLTLKKPAPASPLSMSNFGLTTSNPTLSPYHSRSQLQINNSGSSGLIIEEGTSLSFKSAHHLNVTLHFHSNFSKHHRHPYQQPSTIINNNNNNNNTNQQQQQQQQQSYRSRLQQQQQQQQRLLHPLMKRDPLLDHQRRAVIMQQQQIQLQIQQQQYQQEQFLKNHSFNSLLTA